MVGAKKEDSAFWMVRLYWIEIYSSSERADQLFRIDSFFFILLFQILLAGRLFPSPYIIQITNFFFFLFPMVSMCAMFALRCKRPIVYIFDLRKSNIIYIPRSHFYSQSVCLSESVRPGFAALFGPHVRFRSLPPTFIWCVNFI